MNTFYSHCLRLLAQQQQSPLQLLDWAPATAAGVEVYLKRDDSLHPHVSGNKWRKLMAQVAWLMRSAPKGLATVGGVHSNHLVAVAALAQQLGIPSKGYVRGALPQPLSPSLAFAKTKGMQLQAATREEVRSWRTGTQPMDLDTLAYHWLPEGGTTALSLLGMKQCWREIRQQLGQEPAAYVVPAGSGGTALGLARAATAPVYAVNVTTDHGLPDRMQELITAQTLQLKGPLHWISHPLGGFASGEPVLYQTLLAFKAEQQVVLDPIYTAKAALFLEACLWRGDFAPGEQVVLLHSGGTQGVPAWCARYGYPIPQ